MKSSVYLNADNWEGCDVVLTEMDNRLWVGVGSDDNFGFGYVDARQLYEELKKYFEDDKRRDENNDKWREEK